MNRHLTAAIAALLVAMTAPVAFALDGGGPPAQLAAGGESGDPAKARKRPMRPTFASVDTNQDGDITADEFKASLAKRPRMLKRADKMFGKMDKNKDGKIDMAEFKARRGGGRRKHRRDGGGAGGQ